MRSGAFEHPKGDVEGRGHMTSAQALALLFSAPVLERLEFLPEARNVVFLKPSATISTRAHQRTPVVFDERALDPMAAKRAK